MQRMADDFPVDEIFGMKNRQAGDAVETRRGEVEVIADTDHVRVRVVGINYRIRIRAIRVSHKKAKTEK